MPDEKDSPPPKDQGQGSSQTVNEKLLEEVKRGTEPPPTRPRPDWETRVIKGGSGKR